MKLYRCHNAYCSEDPAGRLIFDFWSDKPVCPKCGTDKRDKENDYLISELAIIHYDPPHPKIANRGLNVLACQPHKKFGTWGKLHVTGDVNSVNCQKCRASEVFRKNYTGEEPTVLHDVELSLDATGTVQMDRYDVIPVNTEEEK